MIDRMGGIVVIVSDQQKAMEFYSQKLGFEIKTDMICCSFINGW
jgi:catechol-2,3-dioxygenase